MSAEDQWFYLKLVAFVVFFPFSVVFSVVYVIGSWFVRKRKRLTAETSKEFVGA